MDQISTYMHVCQIQQMCEQIIPGENSEIMN